MPIYGHMDQISSFMALILAKYQYIWMGPTSFNLYYWFVHFVNFTAQNISKCPFKAKISIENRKKVVSHFLLLLQSASPSSLLLLHFSIFLFELNFRKNVVKCAKNVLNFKIQNWNRKIAATFSSRATCKISSKIEIFRRNSILGDAHWSKSAKL